MSADLFGELPDDAEHVVIAILRSEIRCGIKRDPSDPLPFVVVRRVGGEEDANQFYDEPVVMVKVFAATEAATRAAQKLVHRRMLYVARNLPDITLSDGRKVNLDYLTTFQTAEWFDYAADQIGCMVARYKFGLSFVAL